MMKNKELDEFRHQMGSKKNLYEKTMSIRVPPTTSTTIHPNGCQSSCLLEFQLSPFILVAGPVGIVWFVGVFLLPKALWSPLSCSWSATRLSCILLQMVMKEGSRRVMLTMGQDRDKLSGIWCR